jgi:hypothetical protein
VAVIRLTVAVSGEALVVEGRLYLPAGSEDEEMAASDPLPTLTSIRRVERSKT